MARGIPNEGIDERISETEKRLADLKRAKKERQEKDDQAVGRALRSLGRVKHGDYEVYDLISALPADVRGTFGEFYTWLLNGETGADIKTAMAALEGDSVVGGAAGSQDQSLYPSQGFGG